MSHKNPSPLTPPSPPAPPPAQADVLIFVEDPGAANCVQGLPERLEKSGLSCLLLATGHAAQILEDRGVAALGFKPGITAGELLDRVRPRIVLTGTSENVDSFGLSLLDEAQGRGIRTVGVVDSNANAPYRFRGRSDNPLAHAPEYILVPDEVTRQSFLALGHPEPNLVALGHPRHDIVLEKGRVLAAQGRAFWRQKLFPEAGQRKIVLFAAEICDGLNPRQYRRSPEWTLQGRGAQDRTGVVLEEVLDGIATLPIRPYLVLRLHPKNRQDEFTAYLSDFDTVSSGGDSLEAVYATDLVVGMTSMILMEAALLGVPTLSVVPRNSERDWLPAIAMGLIPCACTPLDIRKLLPVLLEDGNIAPKPDMVATGATKNIVKLILSIITVNCLV